MIHIRKQMSSFTRVELEFCKEVTQKLYEHPLSKVFIHPVDQERDGATNYYEVIKHPMDLEKIKTKLNNGNYDNSAQWSDDVHLVWANAKLYNGKKTPIYLAADHLSKKCIKIFKLIPKTEAELWSLKIQKLNAKLANLLKSPPPEECLIPRSSNLCLK